MKNPKAAPRLLRTGIALALACGLMVPTGALAASEDEARENATPPPGGGTLAEPAADGSEGAPADGGAPEADSAGSAAVFSAIAAAIQYAALYGALPDTDAAPAGNAGAGAAAVATGAADASPRGADYTKSGLTVSGGELNKDFKDTGSAIEVLTGTPLTFKGTSTYAIHIGQGVKADVTLAGVYLTGASTFEVLTNRTGAGEGTYCYLTIKDDTTNILKLASGYGAGLRCGKTSTLVIDDENPNIVAGGSKLNVNDIITPKKGKVGFDGATLNGTAVRADSSLDLLDSEKPGTLKAYARSQSAAIGGSAAEDSGTLIFHGGNIVAMGSCQTEGNLERTTDDGTDDGGAGIGAGNMANGTVIIFNGGNILAKAAFHGSGIGGGYCNGNYFSAANNVRNSNAIVNTKDGISSKSVAGDITINGGYIRSYGSGHGNAFGQACCGTNTKKTITVTGGTLLPWSTTSASYYDIGGAGGYVVITGGSIKLTGAVAGEPYTGNKFQSGEGNKAYNAPVGDPNRQQIFMFCIDLSKSDGVGTEPVASWDLEIGGKPYEYGAPSYFDAGKLYLRLPFSAVGKEITVKLKRYNEDGSLKPVEDLSATPGDSSGSGLGKRWISYELTDEFKTENASLFSKYYDGESIKNLIASLESYVGTDGLPAPYEANKDAKLTNPDALLYQSAKLGDDGKPLDEYYPTEAVHDHKVLPTDSGSISMRVQSKEFAQPGTSTAESFWGHDTSFTVNIFPVNSKTEFTSYTLKSDDGSTLAQLDGPTWMQDDDANPNKASVNHLIVPVDVTSFTYPDGDTVDGSNMTKPTCAAPFGQVQLFLDDRPISAAHGGVMTFTREDLEDEDNDAVAIVKDRDGREHTVLLFDISRSQLEAHGLKSTENDEHTVAAVYTSRTDAKPATTPRAGAGAQAQAAAAPSAVYRNYYDSETERTFVQIQRSDCRFDLYNEKGTDNDPADGASTPIIGDEHAARHLLVRRRGARPHSRGALLRGRLGRGDRCPGRLSPRLPRRLRRRHRGRGLLRGGRARGPRARLRRHQARAARRQRDHLPRRRLLAREGRRGGVRRPRARRPEGAARHRRPRDRRGPGHRHRERGLRLWHRPLRHRDHRADRRPLRHARLALRGHRRAGAGRQRGDRVPLGVEGDLPRGLRRPGAPEPRRRRGHQAEDAAPGEDRRRGAPRPSPGPGHAGRLGPRRHRPGRPHEPPRPRLGSHRPRGQPTPRGPAAESQRAPTSTARSDTLPVRRRAQRCICRPPTSRGAPWHGSSRGACMEALRGAIGPDAGSPRPQWPAADHGRRVLAQGNPQFYRDEANLSELPRLPGRRRAFRDPATP